MPEFMDTRGYTRWEDKGRGSEFTVNAECLKLGTGMMEQKEQAQRPAPAMTVRKGFSLENKPRAL